MKILSSLIFFGVVLKASALPQNGCNEYGCGGGTVDNNGELTGGCGPNGCGGNEGGCGPLGKIKVFCYSLQIVF